MTEDTRQLVTSRDDLELRHHVFQYTFLPTVAICAVMILSAIPLWFVGQISATTALLFPWAALAIVCWYSVFFGDYSMPSETYHRVKNGELDYD